MAVSPKCACCAPAPIPGFLLPPIADGVNGALVYARAGWPVFPCKPVDKRPLTEHGFKDASTDPKQIRAWWTLWPWAMIGVPMGSRSGVFCVDLDRKEADKDGVASWAGYVEHNPTPATLAAESPSTGQHRYFKYFDGARSVALDKIDDGIEIKGDGGYVVVAPSRNLAGRYRWLTPRHIPIADAPVWLRSLILYNTYQFTKPAPEPRERVALDHICAALAVIDPDVTYRIWFEIGCALFAELGDIVGRALFEEWSRTGGKYDPRVVEKVWTSIGKRDGYRYSIGTVFHYGRN